MDNFTDSTGCRLGDFAPDSEMVVKTRLKGLKIRKRGKRTGYYATSARKRLLEFCLTKLPHTLALKVIQVICLDM